MLEQLFQPSESSGETRCSVTTQHFPLTSSTAKLEEQSGCCGEGELQHP